LSHGFGLAGLRIGFLGGRPELVAAILATKSALTRINMNVPMQYAALAALKDKTYIRRAGALLKKNYRTLREIIAGVPRLRFVVEPEYGFFACIDTSGIKATCQELTVALLKRKCAVYPSDGLGEVNPTTYLRLNFSTPHRKHFAWLKAALPEAIKEAESGMYREAVLDFFRSAGTDRAKRIIARMNAPR
jgi:aspartate/methionine/tyrosine aminotransferase